MFLSRQQTIIKDCLVVCSVLSVCSSLVICLKYYYYPRLRTRSAKLVVWLSVSNIGLCLSIICGVYVDSNSNEIQETNTFSFLVNFFLLSNMLWSTAITKTMALVILQRNKLLDLLNAQSITPRTLAVKRMIKFHFVILTCSLALSLVPIFTGSYTDFSMNWYWYNTGWQHQLTAWICYYIPLTFGIMYSGFVFYNLGQVRAIFVDSGLTLGDGKTLAGQLYELAMSLKNYPIASMIVSLWSLIVELKRVCSRHDDSSGSFWMYALLAILQSSQGIFHIFIFFYRSYRRGTLLTADEGIGLFCCAEYASGQHMANNSSIFKSMLASEHNLGPSDDFSQLSSSRPSLVDIERAVDTLCPIFDLAGQNSYFGDGISHGAASDKPYSDSISNTTCSEPHQPVYTVSLRVVNDSDSSVGSQISGANGIRHIENDEHSSFGICFED